MNHPSNEIANDASLECSMDERLKNLFGRINYERQNLPQPGDFKLANMFELVRRLDRPDAEYPIIHVAGTKGKGSVCTFIGAVLSASGRKTGVYTSPHLESIHQRMAIDGQAISDQQLMDVLVEIQPVIEQMDRESDEKQVKRLTFFEVTTAAAMYFFAKEKCDAVILEVGMGGRLDSTNVCEPVVSVITNISLDHTRQLGERVNQIASEKAGIIKPGIPVVSGGTHQEVIPVISQKADEMQAELFQLDRDFFCLSGPPNEQTQAFSTNGVMGEHRYEYGDLQLNVAGLHQKVNASIAVAVCQVLGRVGWVIPDKAIRNGLERARLTGRAEKICDEPSVVVDMAHNVASANALADTILSERKGLPGKRILLFAISNEKDAEGMLEPLLPLFDSVVLTRYQSNPRGRPIPQLEVIVGNICREKQHKTKISTTATPILAWKQISEELTENDYVCVTGSAFLVAELRHEILNWNNNR